MRPENRLAREKSPYLLQHKNNPVDWYPWGAEAFDAAKKANKLVFLSIGYATCHWCHVMEKDSFEREDVAEVLNKNYICIKVDREERPDVDQIHMSALQAIAGGGGWPLSMFLTPEGLPFFGQTFIPRETFKRVLADMADIWQKEPARIITGGNEVRGFLQDKVKAASSTTDGFTANEAALIGFFREAESSFDKKWGGLAGAPKFPHSSHLSVLLRIHRRTANPEALKLVTTSLDAMARGGMYDQLGGGFHRYSTDSEWLVPHFEKMLYDNALLATTYLEAYQTTRNPEYARIARETLEYVLRDLTDPAGPFYSAEDADSELAEGKFYVWSEEELRQILTDEELSVVQGVYGITAGGNFNPDQRVRQLEEDAGLKSVHGVNIFFIPLDKPLPDLSEGRLLSAREKLLKARGARVRPLRDDKILVSWNGLMIAAMAFAFQVLGDPRFLTAAQRAARFIKEKMRASDGGLFARFRDGEARFAGYLDDYAFFIGGLLNLYEADFDESWLGFALELQKIQDRLFWDESGGAYFFTDGFDPTILVRNKESYDGAMPSGNSASAVNLLRIGAIWGELESFEKARRIIRAAQTFLNRAPGAVPLLIQAIDFATDRAKEVVIVADKQDPEAGRLVEALRGRFLPNKVLIWGAGGGSTLTPLLRGRTQIDGKATFYVCEKGACALPVTTQKEALALVDSPSRYQV